MRGYSTVFDFLFVVHGTVIRRRWQAKFFSNMKVQTERQSNICMQMKRKQQNHFQCWVSFVILNFPFTMQQIGQHWLTTLVVFSESMWGSPHSLSHSKANIEIFICKDTLMTSIMLRRPTKDASSIEMPVDLSCEESIT